MAADMEKSNSAIFFEEGSKIILPFVKMIIDKTKKNKKDCFLYGEIIGDNNYTNELLKIGVRDFSVSVFQIPEIISHLEKVINK